MTTLILGGNGYIGSYLQDHLEADVVDWGWYGSEQRLDYKLEDYDTVINLAAHSSIWLCEAEPDGSWQNNVCDFRVLLERLHKGQTLIYASSGSVYGSSSSQSDENSQLQAPLKNYDMHKILGDIMATKAIADGKTVIGLRFGTVNGAAPHTRTDVMINAMVEDALTRRQIKLANMERRRALLFLPDLANAVERIIAKPIAGIYNLASINTTVGDIGQLVQEATGIQATVSEDNASPYDFALDVSKFEATFGTFRSTDSYELTKELMHALSWVRKSRRDVLP